MEGEIVRWMLRAEQAHEVRGKLTSTAQSSAARLARPTNIAILRNGNDRPRSLGPRRVPHEHLTAADRRQVAVIKIEIQTNETFVDLEPLAV